MLITTDAVGGVWSYSLALAAGLSAAGTQCSLAVIGPSPAGHQAREAAAIPGCTLIDTRLELDWLAADRAALDRSAAHLATRAERLGVTSAHLHAPCLAAQGWTIPVVAVAHSCMATWWDAVRGGAMPPDFAWRAAATLQGLIAADRVIAPSAAFAADLARVYLLGRPIDVILNGLPPIQASETPRRAFVLTAGRLWDQAKNMAMLDRAAGTMQAAVHAAGPTKAPDGSCFSPEHMITPGSLTPGHLRTAMSLTAAFAAPSCYEPFGLAVLEAAQTGAPLVLSDIPTFRELWDGAALFVPPHDAGAWANVLDGLVQDAPRRAALGQAARQRAARTTQDRMVAATAALHAGLSVSIRQVA